MAESKEELKSFLMKVKEENEKVDLKLNIQKTKIMASSLITSWQIDGRQWKKWQTLFCFGAPKSAFFYGFPGGSEDKAFACNAGDPGLIPGLGRPLEKEMATHSSLLAWRIPWTEEPGGLQSTGLQRVGHDWATSHTLTHTNLQMVTAAMKVKDACSLEEKLWPT